MLDQRNYSDQAAAVLQRAMKATGLGEQARLLDEAMRLNRLAQERAKLGANGHSPSDPGDRQAS
jgi:hypothetical protein